MASKETMTLRFLAEPTDVNFKGNVHGGTVMKWIDQVGYSCAVAWSETYCVTVHVGAIKFFRPVKIGSLVELTAKIINTGKTSMHIWIDVKSGTLESGTLKRTTTCFISFVSVNDEGKPIPVKQFVPSNDNERKLERFALNMVASDKQMVEEISDLIED